MTIDKNRTMNVLLLGACPALAASSTVKGSMGIALALTFVLFLSSVVMYLLKKVCTDSSKTICTVIITAGFASMIQMLMAAYLPKVSSMLGIYIALCALNAMMSKIEGRPVEGLYSCIVFISMVIAMGVVRELIGSGTFWGVKVPFLSTHSIPAIAKAPGALIVFSILLAVFSAVRKEAE